MKILHDSLDSLLAELAELQARTVRVSSLIQSEPAAPMAGVPQLTVRIVVTAMVDERLWAEWRLWVGRSLAEVGETGVRLPDTLRRRVQDRLAEVRRRVEAAGLAIREGLLAHDATSMDVFAS
jgi:hypothetical protein